MSCLVPTARVLPGVPHQEGLRGDRAEHLSPQPRLWSHVLTEEDLCSGGGRGREGGVGSGVVVDVGDGGAFVLLIISSALALWDVKIDLE